MSHIAPSKSTPQAAVEPILTKGNFFWRGDDRFLIKGICYTRRKANDGASGRYSEQLLDPLADDHLEELTRDSRVFVELGLNTIQVLGVDPLNDHAKAMNLLAEHGIYVIAELGEKIKTPNDVTLQDPTFDMSRSYTLFVLRRTLRIVDGLCDFSNLLGFKIDAGPAREGPISRMAEIKRALVRDTKAFLQIRPGRKPPVGINISHLMSVLRFNIEYFTAGTPAERADFLGMENFSWANVSNFQVSGWKGLVENTVSHFPVPMYLSEFGSYTGKPRIFTEIECLYSPDMTGSFSGGCLYTFMEYNNNYGIVRVAENGELEKKPEYKNLKRRFDVINDRSVDEVHNAEAKAYEGWQGVFPAAQGRWLARSQLPPAPAGIDQLWQEIKSEKDSNERERLRTGVEKLRLDS